jgi:hypothetical protein
MNFQSMDLDQATSDECRWLLRHAVDYLLNGALNDRTVDRDFIIARIAKLLRRVDAAMRREVAERLADEPSTPLALATMLVGEAAPIARPILRRSVVLDDDSILKHSKTMTTAHWLAVSARTVLSERLVAALVTHANPLAIRNTCRNPGARIARATFRDLLRRTASDERLAAVLIRRTDLAPDQRARLMCVIEDRIHQACGSSSADASGRPNALRRHFEALRRLHLRPVRSTGQILHQLKMGEANIEEEIAALAYRDRALDVAHLIAFETGFESGFVIRAMLAPSTRPLIFLSKSFDLPWGQTEHLLRLRARRRAELLRPDPNDFMLHATLVPSQARQTLRRVAEHRRAPSYH